MESKSPLQALCDQAIQLHNQGEFAEAEKLCLQVLQADPSSFAARHLLGAVRYQQGRALEALDLFRAALEIDPDSAEALSNCGAALKTLGRLDEALAVYDKALALKPDFAMAMNGRGATLSDMNRFEEALADYNRALARRPDLATAISNRGRVLQYLGRLDEARADYVVSLTVDPGMANVYLDYMDSAKVCAGDPLLAAMEGMRGRPGLSDGDKIYLDFALAKAYADLGDHPRSFRALLRGNALKRARVEYNESAAFGFFDRIQSIFSAGLVREKQALGGDPSPAPIFILGMMRSGSTLVEQILASHPDVHGAGELPTLGNLVNGVRGPDGKPIPYPEFMPTLDAAALRQFGARYLAEIRKQAPFAPHVTDKMPENFFFAGLIHLALPNARIIHTMRDPVDTCVSCFSKLFTAEQNHTYDLAELGRYHRRYQKLMAHWHAILPPGRILDVRYEDVVGDLEGQARRIIAHCGLDWDARCLSFHATDRPVRTASVSQVRQQIYRDAVGRAQAYEEFLGPLRQALAGG